MANKSNSKLWDLFFEKSRREAGGRDGPTSAAPNLQTGFVVINQDLLPENDWWWKNTSSNRRHPCVRGLFNGQDQPLEKVGPSRRRAAPKKRR